MNNTISIDNKIVPYESTMTLKLISEQYKSDKLGSIVLAIKNGKLTELNKPVKDGDVIELLDTTSHDGYRTYQRSLSFVLIKAVKDLAEGREDVQVRINFAINSGYYCEIEGIDITENYIDELKKRMLGIIELDIPFIKRTVHVDKAREIFKKQGMTDKMKLFKYRKASNVNLYELDGLMDYFYGYMVPSTGILKGFNIHKYNNGLVLQFVKRENPQEVAKFDPDLMLFQTLLDSMNWASIMNLFDVGSLNDLVAEGQANETILVMEALMEKRIGNVADQIVEDIENRKFVFIAGPSSSGKTTFAHRLGIQMKAHGIKPNIISVDNYFKNREDTPKDANGNYNFECLEAINVEAFNRDMLDLLAGKAVDIPVFNFVEGKCEYRGNYITMGPSDILIIEGIHGLNNGLSYSIPEQNKFKIYISALTQLNVDFHNRIPTTDTRLIRRIVRDNQYRGASATKTIGMWPSVRHGEDNYIFPFQEGADVMFNSALIYELAVLKQYAEPLLLNVPQDSKEYIEAKRLVKFLDYFVTIPSEQIPTNSLIREFIGGSCFRT